MSDIHMTFRGNAADRPRLWENGERPYARVNVASTPRRRVDGQWVDDQTQWIQVKAWGRLARNMAASIRKGDAVIVTGVFRHDEYTDGEGNVHKTAVVHAAGVGVDLRRASAMVVNTREDDPEEKAARTTESEHEAPEVGGGPWGAVSEDGVNAQVAPF